MNSKLSNETKGEIRWQLGIRSFRAGIAHICRSKEFADVTIRVGNRIFKGHRLILAAKSPQFTRLLKMDGPDPLPHMSEITLTGISEDACEIMFNYIYTNKIGNMDTRELVVDVYFAASAYEQIGLRTACEELMDQWVITCDNVISMLQMCDVPFLKNRCWQYISGNARTLLSSDGILPAYTETLSQIFEKGYLNGVPAVELFKNVVRWAENLFRKPKEEENVDYTTVREHLLVPSGDMHRCLMSWIGFERFTDAELDILDNYPELVTDKEFRIIRRYVRASADKKPGLPLPSWIEF